MYMTLIRKETFPSMPLQKFRNTFKWAPQAGPYILVISVVGQFYDRLPFFILREKGRRGVHSVFHNAREKTGKIIKV